MTVGTESTWFRRYPVTRPRARLLCLPHAGGSASFFHSWGHALGADVEVLVASYPGRLYRISEPCIEHMDPLAEAVTREILPFLDVPLMVFGHSMGASLAYEVGLRLEKEHGTAPAGLFVSSRKAPHKVVPNQVYLGGDDALIAYVQGLGGTDASILDNPDLRELVLPAIRADFRIVGTYEPRPPVPVGCPIFAYVGDSDRFVNVTDMRAWGDVATGGFDVREFHGGHFYLAGQQPALIRDVVARMP
ncbi:thioesterase II family protein [Streptomyces sp. XD-27]|uniref:thioesterase II family protein n=1 Tax=Streptomyces sp. XD-27 TaxID=3062779 RepID=UPI0026F449CE|nr:alpha/beta fold hydrolase [Streptomyces sp. XD-27]WKX71075.1 thioesterase domain-containing protein [Streptomyces sp. XD-27]